MIYRGSSRRKKDCVIRLTSSQFEADQVDLTILLIVELIPGLPTHCDSPISAKATIRVNFCRLGTPTCSFNYASAENVLERSGRLSVTETERGVVVTRRSVVRSEKTTKKTVSDLVRAESEV